MEETPGFTKVLSEMKDVDEQLELCKQLLARVTGDSVRGLLLTIAEQPDPKTLTREQLAELEAHGLKPEEATRVSHVLIGSVDTLIHLLKATALCISETHKSMAQEKQEFAQKELEARPAGTVLH